MKDMTDKQAQRLAEWLKQHGFTQTKINDAVAHMMGIKKEKPQPRTK